MEVYLHRFPLMYVFKILMGHENLHSVIPHIYKDLWECKPKRTQRTNFWKVQKCMLLKGKVFWFLVTKNAPFWECGNTSSEPFIQEWKAYIIILRGHLTCFHILSNAPTLNLMSSNDQHQPLVYSNNPMLIITGEESHRIGTNRDIVKEIKVHHGL